MSTTTNRVPVGVALLLINHKGECLLHRRKGAHGAGTLSFPGGALDPGEEPVQAAYRELEEEAGIVCDMPIIFHPQPWVNTIFDEGQQWITLYFIAAHSGVDPKIMEPEKNDGWRWVPLAHLPPDEELFAPLHQIRKYLSSFCLSSDFKDFCQRSREVQNIPHE